MDGFKIPEYIPQDLILIHDLVAVAPVQICQNSEVPIPIDDSIESSGSENGSEDEIEADLVLKPELTLLAKPICVSDSDLDSDSDSDPDTDSDISESNNDKKDSNPKDQDQDGDEEDEPGPVATTRSYFQTKNEVVEADVIIPDIEEVGPEEEVEKVGEVMSIVDNVVIIKGLASEVANRGSGKALDTDTLLVFEDRKVMGYVFETFGPTSQPFYQVKFNQRYPLDTEKVRVSRQVFHVPHRSNFVFLSQIRCLKGSDASNVHDEEPAEEELEFSDDEQEAAHKSLKRKRGGESRANSVASSRHATPMLQDLDLPDSRFLGATPYDEHGPYDMDFLAGPSRPPPTPYDDPYSDDYNNVGTSSCEIAEGSASVEQQTNSRPIREGERGRGTGRGRGRGRGESRDSRQSAGRGQRGRGPGNRGRGDRGRGGRGDRGQSHRRSHDETEPGWAEQSIAAMHPYNPHPARSLSPTSLAIARATGQYPGGANFDNPAVDDSVGSGLSFRQFLQQQSYQRPQHQQPHQQPQHQQPQHQQQYVQPHINPRFASAFGMNMNLMQAQYSPQYWQGPEPAVHENSHWTDEWTVHAAQGDR